MLSPRTLRSSVLLAAALAPIAACGKTREPARHVILITCDTLRADRLGVYGYGRATSPNLDAFAREAVVFDEAYATAPATGPALSSLFSGRLPDEIGVAAGNQFPMPAEALSLTEIVRDAGITTSAVISNWVLRRTDPAGQTGVAQGFQTFDDQMPAREQHRDMYERVAPATTDAALAWLERAGDAPFFLWVHYQDPHGPYTAPPEQVARVERPMSDEAPLALGKTDSGIGQIPKYQGLGTERRPEAYRIQYDAEIAYFDEHVGRLLEWLREQSWYEDALIVFSADHGESMGEHGYWFCHGQSLSRETVRVPLVVRFPSGARHVATRDRDGYARVGELASHLDLWPTILEAYGLVAPPNRGLSLFAERLPESRIHFQVVAARESPWRWTGISDGRWRLVVERQSPPRLYDISADPYESRDRAAAEPERVADLLARCETFLATHAGAALAQGPPTSDAQTQKALQRFGYTGDEEPSDH